MQMVKKIISCNFHSQTFKPLSNLSLNLGYANSEIKSHIVKVGVFLTSYIRVLDIICESYLIASIGAIQLCFPAVFDKSRCLT